MGLMQHQSSESRDLERSTLNQTSLGPWVTGVFLAVFAVFIIVTLTHYYNWPVDRDMSLYASAANELIHGEKLYSSVWDVKPPAIWMTFMLAQMVVGYNSGMILFLSCVISLTLLVGFYLVGRDSGYGSWAGILAAGMWALIAGDVRFHLCEPFPEHFMNAAILFSIWVFLKRSDGSIKSAIVIGLLWFIASMYKHSIVLAMAAFGLCYLLMAAYQKRLKLALKDLLVIAGVGCVGWLCVFGYFTMTGRFTIFYQTMFTWAMDRFSSPIDNVWIKSSPQWMYLPFERLKFYIYPMLFAIGGIVAGCSHKKQQVWWLLAFYMLFAHIASTSHRTSYAHYYYYWIPPLLLGTACALVAIGRASFYGARVFGIGLALVLMASLFIPQMPFYGKDFDELYSKGIYDVYKEERRLGYDLYSLMNENDRLFLWGKDMGVYFFSHSRPSQSVIYHDAMCEGIFKEKFTKITLQRLEQHPPKLVIIRNGYMKKFPEHPVLDWISQRYQPNQEWSKQYRYFTILQPYQSHSPTIDQ